MDSQNQQNQQSPNPPYQQTIVIVSKPKSVGVAFALAFLFGPLGLLYASIVGGIVMFILGIIISIVTLGFGLIFVWIACIIWAIVASNNANNKISSTAGVNINLGTTSALPQSINEASPQQSINQSFPPAMQQLPAQQTTNQQLVKTIILVLIAIVFIVVLIQNTGRDHLDFLWTAFYMSKLLMLALVAVIAFVLGWLISDLNIIKRLSGGFTNNNLDKGDHK
jgi:uncharacterized integral membrane protein